MAKATAVKEKVSIGIGKVSTAIANAYGKQAISGELLTVVCKICFTVFGGEPANSIDQKRVAEDVARIRGWTKASEGPRKSEVRKIVRNYARFEDASEIYRRTNDSFPWGVAMRLLTCLNRESSNTKALALMKVNNGAMKIVPTKVIANSVSRIMNLETKAAKIVAFQDALETLCRKHEMDW